MGGFWAGIRLCMALMVHVQDVFFSCLLFLPICVCVCAVCVLFRRFVCRTFVFLCGANVRIVHACFVRVGYLLGIYLVLGISGGRSLRCPASLFHCELRCVLRC